MILFRDELPNRFYMDESIYDNKITYKLFSDVGEYQKHDDLFEKYNIEPSGYDWEDIVKKRLEQVAPELLKDINFDCNGDEFLVFTKNENAQINLAKYFLEICNNAELLETILSQISEKNIL